MVGYSHEKLSLYVCLRREYEMAEARKQFSLDSSKMS